MKPDQILASLSQLDHQKRPVTLVAIAFFSLVCLSLAGMQGWSVHMAREKQLAAAQVATVAMTRTLADHISTTLNTTDALLADLADRVENGSGDDAERLPQYIAQRMARHPMLAGLSLYDQSGVLVLGSNAAGSPAALPLHTEYHRGNAGGALFIGKALHDGAGKLWLLPVTRRLTMPDGSYGGMVLVSMRLAQLHDFARQFDLGPHGSITVTFDSGALMMAHPDSARATGQAGRGGPLSSYRRLDGYPLVVTVSRSVDDALAGWWESAYLSTAGAALLLLLQLWLGIRLYSQIALRDRLEKERRILQKLLVKKSRSLRHQALKDALTGIANRRQLDIRLVREFNRAIDENRTLAIVILDVDHFKKYNDQHGHPAGDECLKFIANCVNGGRRRSEDLAARMGGEEFAILLPNTGLRGAIAVAESIRKTVASQRLTHIDGFSHSVTVSCGVHALIPVEGMLSQELIAAADRALYLAKSSGRNRVRAEGSVPPTRGRRFSLVVNK